ncbi:MAG: twin-arginine translocation signal domain-containing protein [Candidatus Acidiferrales bacterium]
MLTRRDFVTKLAVAGAAIGAFALAPGAEWPADASVRLEQPRKPVVSFHMDRPYLDPTGTAMPYRPPGGARSGAPVARLSEETFRRMQCYA